MDIITRLESDHRLLLMAAGRVLIQVEQEWAGAPGSRAGEALDLLRRLKARITRHEEIEDGLLHPVLRACSPGCLELLDGLEREHRGIDEIVDSLISAMAGEGNRVDIKQNLDDFDRRLRRHLFHEEQRVFSAVERDVPFEDLMRLGEEAESQVSR